MNDAFAAGSPGLLDAALLAVALPFEFDTTDAGRAILRGTLGLEVLVLVTGVLGSALNANPRTTVLAVLLVSMMLVGAGVLLFRKLAGSSGTISADRVVVTADRLFGVQSEAPHGDFPVDRFDCVRIDRMSGNVGNSNPYERVYLVGRDSTPDILIARTQNESGIELARQLGALLRLPVEERHAAY